MESAVLQACAQFSHAKLSADDLALCLVDASNQQQSRWSGHREHQEIYPASVVKMFYAVAAYHWFEEGKIAETAEFERAMHDMIVDSSADATGYIVDLITGTTSGPELSEPEMKIWAKKRNVVNEYFIERGYKKLNINQKPLSDGAFGRERIFREQRLQGQDNLNRLTARATAQLILEIVNHEALSPANCKKLLAFMHRDRSIPSDDPNSQIQAFLGKILPPDANYWSKAGWSSKVRHDAAYIELASGTKLCLVIFTTNHADEPDLIAFLGQKILEAITA